MNKKTFWIIGLLIILILIAVGVSKLPSKNNDQNIKIGGIFILSGEGASWGEAARNGMELAIKEINDSGGIDGKSLQGLYEDGGSEPQKTISAFNKLTNVDKVKFIIGPNWSNTGTVLIPLIKAKNIVEISPSLGVAEFNESSPYIFNTWPHDFILSQNLAQYVYDKGYRNVALLGANQVWVKDQTKAFTEKFQASGGKIDFLYEPPTTETNVQTEITKIKNNPNIDAIIMTTDGQDITDIFAQRIKDFGIKLPIFSITVDRSIIKNCNGSCEGMIFLTFLTPTAEFEQKYKATYNREVEIGADSAYDAIMMLAKAFKETDSTDPTIIETYLNRIKNYAGASGNLVSDGKGAFTKPYEIKQVKNGEPVTIPK